MLSIFGDSEIWEAHSESDSEEDDQFEEKLALFKARFEIKEADKRASQKT